MRIPNPAVRDIALAELTECLQWLLQKVELERAQWIVAQLTDRVERKQLNDIFAALLPLIDAKNDEKIAAAAIAILQPPAAAILLAMGATNNEPLDDLAATEAVLQHLKRRLHGCGVRFLQASSDSANDVQRLQKLGFEHLADLAFLVLEADKFAPLGEVKSKFDCCFEVIGASAARLAEACQIAEQSFAETQDCPRLGAFRSAGEIVQGYRLAANFDPALWRLLRVEGEPVGCLFLTHHKIVDADSQASKNHSTGAIEISYMGLVPRHRGRQLGELILNEAVRIATQFNTSRLVLAVDRANLPANNLYRRRGWIEVAQESVWGIRIDP